MAANHFKHAVLVDAVVVAVDIGAHDEGTALQVRLHSAQRRLRTAMALDTGAARRHFAAASPEPWTGLWVQFEPGPFFLAAFFVRLTIRLATTSNFRRAKRRLYSPYCFSLSPSVRFALLYINRKLAIAINKNTNAVMNLKTPGLRNKVIAKNGTLKTNPGEAPPYTL